jgi:hypothetical protein
LKEEAEMPCLSNTRDDVIERGLLVFGLQMQVVMDAKQLVPIMGADATTWRALKRGLARLELAGYVERNPFAPRRFYRRTVLGTELAHRILMDPAITIVTTIDAPRKKQGRTARP